MKRLTVGDLRQKLMNLPANMEVVVTGEYDRGFFLSADAIGVDTLAEIYETTVVHKEKEVFVVGVDTYFFESYDVGHVINAVCSPDEADGLNQDD